MNLQTNLRFLHVGCGRARPESLPACFRSGRWQEIRLDIDPEVSPDIVSSITNMSQVADASMNAVWSSHNLEHLNSFEVPLALNEFRRVLRDDGFLLLTLPDLEAVARHIIAGNLDETLYMSQAGPIRPLDILFGHQEAIAQGRHFMAHRTGFTQSTLGKHLLEAQFHEVRVLTGKRWDLWAVATMPNTSPQVFEELAGVAG